MRLFLFSPRFRSLLAVCWFVSPGLLSAAYTEAIHSATIAGGEAVIASDAGNEAAGNEAADTGAKRYLLPIPIPGAAKHFCRFRGILK